MVKIIGLILLIFLSTAMFSRSEAQVTTVVATEKAFAKLAEEKGTKTAFLANLTDDAVVFLPEKVNAKEYWSKRAESKALLSWAPNFADISSDGKIGYTTGNWEYRPNGKGDQPAAFGEFITIWLRQPNGEYKFAVDIGIAHETRDVFSTQWVSPKRNERAKSKTKGSAAESANKFLSRLEAGGSARAYKDYASDNIRLFREGKFPFLGKRDALKAVTYEKGRSLTLQQTGLAGAPDLSYVLSTYAVTDGEKVVEKGNYMQIWKLEKSGWRIVLDIFKPVQ